MDKNLLDLYTDYLLCSFGPVTATGLAQRLDGAVSHDQITRLLAAAPKTSADLWRQVKPFVRQVAQPDGVLIIDDSLQEKPYTDENELVAWHWDNAQGRTVKGINFLTAFYQVAQVGLPVAFDLVAKTERYRDPKTGQEKRRSPMSKNARYRMLLRVAVHNEVPFAYVLNDVWYASADNMKFVQQTLKKHFVMPLKENRLVAVSGADKQQGRYTAVAQLALPAGTAPQVWLEQVPFPVRLTKEVFTNADRSQGVRYLVTSDLTLTYDQIVQLYQRRWSVEVYHKSLKQNAALERSPTRTETTQRNHLFASLCAYLKLEGLKLQTGVTHFALKAKLYRAALRTAYAELVKLEPLTLGA